MSVTRLQRDVCRGSIFRVEWGCLPGHLFGASINIASNCRSTGYAQSPAYRQRTCTCAYKQRDSMDINNGKQGNGKKPSAQDFHCRTEESPASAGSQSHCGSDHASMPCPPVGSCTVLVSSCSYTQQQQPRPPGAKRTRSSRTH